LPYCFNQKRRNMPDNFRGHFDELESRLPPDLEGMVLQQANNLALFGNVVELFVPNALHTAARLIGGDGGPRPQGGGRGLEPDPPDWRTKPR
jgi:hypothetical protein